MVSYSSLFDFYQVKSTNSLPFLKESEKDYWNKLLDSNIRAGTMACMWCMKAQLVKKTSLAFHRWKFVVARQSWYNNSSPSKSIQNTASRATSSSPPQSTEKLLNHAGARPVSAVLANAMQLVNTLKESDAERDVNTRLFASPSASVKAANAAATSGALLILCFEDVMDKNSHYYYSFSNRQCWNWTPRPPALFLPDTPGNAAAAPGVTVPSTRRVASRSKVVSREVVARATLQRRSLRTTSSGWRTYCAVFCRMEVLPVQVCSLHYCTNSSIRCACDLASLLKSCDCFY